MIVVYQDSNVVLYGQVEDGDPEKTPSGEQPSHVKTDIDMSDQETTMMAWAVWDAS